MPDVHNYANSLQQIATQKSLSDALLAGGTPEVLMDFAFGIEKVKIGGVNA